jgi:ceramide glucosyltransferase
MTDPFVLIIVALAVTHAVLLLIVAPLRGWKRCGMRGEHSAVRLHTTVIVPCCGDLDGQLSDNLYAIASQDRRPDRLILVARTDKDAAIPTMRHLQRAFPFVEMIVSGKAERCGQKNHNLLAAIKVAGDAEVYVFADSDIRPDRSWLDALLDPLESDPNIGAATALCDLPPDGDSVVGVTQALFTLHQSSFQRLIAVTWGGSTAVRACLFHAAGVATEWAQTVLDDWVLWRRVAPFAKIVTVPVIVSGAKSRARTWSDCLSWNVRQFQYFRLYGALGFHTLLATQIVTTVLVGYLPLRALLMGLPFIEALGPSSGYMLLMTFVNLLLFRCARGRRIAFRQRLCASFLAAPLIAFVTIAAWLQRNMIWRGITYRVDRSGRVRSMEVTEPELQGEAMVGSMGTHVGVPRTEAVALAGEVFPTAPLS